MSLKSFHSALGRAERCFHRAADLVFRLYNLQVTHWEGSSHLRLPLLSQHLAFWTCVKIFSCHHLERKKTKWFPSWHIWSICTRTNKSCWLTLFTGLNHRTRIDVWINALLYHVCQHGVFFCCVACLKWKPYWTVFMISRMPLLTLFCGHTLWPKPSLTIRFEKMILLDDRNGMKGSISIIALRSVQSLGQHNPWMQEKMVSAAPPCLV